MAQDATPLPLQPSVAPNTTVQQDMTALGQRHINVMWERTQQIISIAVTATTLVLCLYIVMCMNKDLQSQAMANQAFSLLSNVFFLVVGTYFQRTNHTKVGGVGGGPPEPTR